MAQIPPFTNFDPEIAATLGAAYDEVVARLLNQPDIVRETTAKRIVALAAKGERDVHALCDKALIAEGFLSQTHDGDYSGSLVEVVMARVEDYRAYAKQYFERAQEADSEELRRASLEMASYWMEAAMRTESLGDSHVEPKRSAA